MKRRQFLASTVVGGLIGADWPRFRGPNGVGQAEGLTWAGTTPLTKSLLWETPLPGVGNGSPVVRAGQIYLQAASQDGRERQLLRLDAATGRVVWGVSRPGQSAHAHRKNSLASSTPALDDQRIVTIHWDGSQVEVVAYQPDGQVRWATKLGGYVSQHGLGCSPIVEAGRVYVNYDQDGAAELVCLEAASGKILWRAERKAFRACYSTPLVRSRAGGPTECINVSTAGVTVYDAATGKVLQDWPWKFEGNPLRTVGSPFLVGDDLVIFSGDGGGSRSMAVLSLAGEKPVALWEKRRDVPYVPGPVAHTGHLYWVTDGGIASCVDLKSGRLRWSERVFSRPVSASLIGLGGVVLAIAEDGKAVAFKAQPSHWEMLSETDLGDAVFATPAVADGRLFIRTNRRLLAIGA